MKILIFCTVYTTSSQEWAVRYSRWLAAIARSGIPHDEVLLVDDGSKTLPDWPGLVIVRERDCPAPSDAPAPGGTVLYHFENNLGRASVWNFPGWHRSFAFAALYAEAHGFERVIHIESDAFLISPRIRAYIAGITEGWVALYSEKYNFPELAFQVIAGSQVAAFAAWARRPYAEMVDKCHETQLPFTKVERGFVGDRYGEHLHHIPRNADYAAQVQIGREESYYWWMGGDNPPAPEPAAPDIQAIDIQFGQGANGTDYATIGWSYPEAGLRWMIGQESELRLPPIANRQAATLTLRLLPHVWKDVLKSQHLVVELNGTAIGDFTLSAETVVTCHIPAGAFRASQENVLHFLHPDRASPQNVSKAPDTRLLAIAAVRASLAFAPAS